MANIMIVDDDIQVLNALVRVLRTTEYQVSLYNDPQKAVQQMDSVTWDVIICDYRMQGINGLEVLKTAKRLVPDAVRILMTGYSDIDVIIQAVNEGSIFKYLSKPWDNQQLLLLIEESVMHKQKADHNNQLINDILAENSEWSLIANSLEYRMMQMNEQGVKALLKTIKAKDESLYQHSLSVAWVALRIGDSLRLRKADLQTLRLSALFHDIGKIAIRDSVLTKNDSLDLYEREEMIHHPEVSAEILKEMDFMREVSEIVIQHHERCDGSGYPKGLTDSGIKLLSKILAVSDVYVALRERRSYKAALTRDEALHMIQLDAGKGLDATIVERFCKVIAAVELPMSIEELEEV